MRTQETILLAEDNPHDRFLLEESFAQVQLDVRIEAVSDGEQLLGRLHDGERRDYGLIVLDAHLPRRSAQEVLEAFHAAQGELPAPVVILSSMLADGDRTRLRELGVQSFLTKPLDLDEYAELAKTLHAMLRPGA